MRARAYGVLGLALKRRGDARRALEVREGCSRESGESVSPSLASYFRTGPALLACAALEFSAWRCRERWKCSQKGRALRKISKAKSAFATIPCCSDFPLCRSNFGWSFFFFRKNN